MHLKRLDCARAVCHGPALGAGRGKRVNPKLGTQLLIWAIHMARDHLFMILSVASRFAPAPTAAILTASVSPALGLGAGFVHLQRSAFEFFAV